ncbi:MAG: serine hydrolase [Flavobacteriaceae bacterium]|nr:serine hydrolase [Flavobacteriaceae bacterium]
MKKQILFLVLFSVQLIFGQKNPLITKDSIAQLKWTDSLLSKMTIDQKIGQLFMLAAYSNKDKKHIDFVESIIQKYQIGGLIFMQGTPEKQIELNNKYQWLSEIPLLIAFDGEWGLDMRLKNTYRYPWNMTLGAIRNDKLIEDFGRRLGEQCKRMGIHVNFAPVVDINTNPKNPIIGSRSFGENKYNVTNKSIAFTKGLQSQNVMACAKHFPGHGDTNTDSHKMLPTINFTAERIDTIELYPYKQLFKNGIGSVMTAHLSVPSLEKNVKIPSSLSHTVLTDLLKNKMQFKGLIFTDALNMKGVSEFVEDELETSKSLKNNKGKIDLKALLAGNDVLLFSEDVGAAVKQIKNALKNKTLTEERINESVRKILNAKYWCGLNNYEHIEIKNIKEDLNTVKDEILYRKLIRNAITLVKNENATFPIRDLVKSKIAYIKFGEAANETFINRLNDYTDITVFKGDDLSLLDKITNYNTIIFGVHKSDANPWKSYSLKKVALESIQVITDLVKSQSSENKVILNIFASPYTLLDIKDFSNIDAVLMSYQNSKIAQDLSAQIIFGAIGTKGKLPVNIGSDFSEGFGLRSANLMRLSFGLPEEEAMSTLKLKRIDSIAKIVLTKKMTPGMQVLIARNGKVIFQKNYGHYTDKKVKKVVNKSIYDLASLTKILGGLPQIMKAEEQGKFSINSRFDEVFPVTKNSNKNTVTIKEALAHTGRLRPWIPFYIETIDSTKKPSKKYYRTTKNKKFSIRVAKNLYLRRDYMDSIYQRIADAPQRIKPGYKYSGFVFYLFKDFIEKQYKKPFDLLNDEEFYLPLGAKKLTYKPLDKYKKEQIVPTERDTYFRHQLLQGDVHDMGAAMLDGVSGNAGLFGNSLDVAKMMQMYLQKGYYGGKRYLKTKTLEKFNTRYFKDKKNRRGLGFDKQQINKNEKATCDCVSEASFGHSGFTGTYAWADPKSKIVYIFLSNRVYPTMENRGLTKENIRTKIQRVIQEAIIDTDFID